MVQLKRKVTLRKKTSIEDPIAQPSNNVLARKSKKALFLIVAVGVLVLISILFLPDKTAPLSSNSEVTSTEPHATEESVQDATTPVPTDSLAENNEVTSSIKDATTDEITTDTPIEIRDEISSESTKKAQKESYPEEPKEKASFSSNTLDEKAKSVIRGNFGNGQERKDKLGAEYNAIQARVNEMYRNGLVK